MDLDALILIGLVLFGASTLQCAAGFGFGLFTVPALLLMGRAPYEAVAIVSIAASGQCLFGLWALRRHIPWKLVGIGVGLALPGVPAGVAVLSQLSELEASTVRRIFGGLVLLALAVQVGLRFKPRERLPGWTMLLAFPMSGFTGGLSGMGGPPVVLWVMAHTWTGEKSRTLLWSLFACMTPVQLILLRGRFGPSVTTAMGEAVLLLPAVALGIIPGMWIGRRLPGPRLRVLSAVILAAIGVIAVARP